MPKLLGGVVALIGVFWLALAGGGAVYWWATRAPLGWGQVHVLWWHFGLPDSPGAKLAAMQDVARKAQAHQVKVVELRGKVSADADKRERAAQERIRTVYRTITKEVPTYVTPEIDRTYPLPVGLVRLHDAAARGVDVSAVPDPAGLADDARATATASDLAGAIVGNYGACRADIEQLTALQAWARGQAAIN